MHLLPRWRPLETDDHHVCPRDPHAAAEQALRGAGLRPLAPGPAPCGVLAVLRRGFGGSGEAQEAPGASKAAAPLRKHCYCKMAFPPTLRASVGDASLHLKARCRGRARSRGFPPCPRARRRLSLPLRRMGSRRGLHAAGRRRPPGVQGRRRASLPPPAGAPPPPPAAGQGHARTGSAPAPPRRLIYMRPRPRPGRLKRRVLVPRGQPRRVQLRISR